MNSKINFQELTELLALKSGISRKDSESFLRALFSLMEEALIEDKQIKIKDLGTFKLITMEERESVDVRTGQRMVIPAHQKISFIPATHLADTVNAPFILFEPVEIDEKEKDHPQPASKQIEREVVVSDNIEQPAPVTFQPHPDPIVPSPDEHIISSDKTQSTDNAFSMENIFQLSKEDLERIRKNREEEENIMKRKKYLLRALSAVIVVIVIAGGIWLYDRDKQKTRDEYAKIINIPPPPIDAIDSINRVSQIKPPSVVRNVTSIYETNLSDTTNNPENNNEVIIPPGRNPVATPPNTPKPSPAPPVNTPSAAAEDKMTTELAQSATVAKSATETKPATTQTKPATTETKLATTQTKPAITETKPAITETKPAITETKPATTETKPATTETKPATTETKPATTETKPATTETKPVKPAETLIASVDANNQANAASKTRRIKSGERLTLVSLSEYGHKAFWVYIYMENKNRISNFNDVPVGLEIVIPPAQKYSINSHDPASIEKAKRLEDELLHR